MGSTLLFILCDANKYKFTCQKIILNVDFKLHCEDDGGVLLEGDKHAVEPEDSVGVEGAVVKIEGDGGSV